VTVTAYVGLGGNLGEVRPRLEAALSALGQVPGIQVDACSRFWRTPPWGPIDQPDFVNAAAALHTVLPPLALLDALLATEQAFGRVRTGERWGPRTIDLDLLAYGDQVIDHPRLCVPHPRMARRAFVLLPLADIAADVTLPGHGRVADLAAQVDATGVVPLEPHASPRP
jgi:2-amino-4-hydroxy-6-hydroxymethyldihydropteridine diphosphokinase